MQKVLIAILFSASISTAVTKSAIIKDFLGNKKITLNQNQNDVITVQDKTKLNNAVKLTTNKEKEVFNYVNTYAPLEYKASEVIKQHFENVRNSNKQLNFKIIQTNETLNGNYTTLGEKLASFKLNTTIPRPEYIPEMTAPTMIPIFRPIQSNVKSTPQPLPNELIRLDEVLKQTNNSDPNHKINPEKDNDIIFLNNLQINNSSKNEIEMLNLDQMLNLFKQQNGAHLQMVNIADKRSTDLNAVAEIPNYNNIETVSLKKNEEKPSTNGLEITDIINPTLNFINTIPNGYPERVGSPSIGESSHKNNAIDLHIDTRHPLLKFEFIPFSEQNNPSNIQNFNLPLDIPVPNELNTNSKAIPQHPQNFMGPPNNLIIESMKFIPYYEIQREMESKRNALPNILTQNEITPISSTIDTVPTSGLSGRKNVVVPREIQQTNHVPNARFNIPCHKAADVLNDLLEYNPSTTQQHIEPKSKHLPEDSKANMPCDVIESGKEKLEDESLAIVFKPKNISLLKLYGDVLKKITLTVLVPTRRHHPDLVSAAHDRYLTCRPQAHRRGSPAHQQLGPTVTLHLSRLTVDWSNSAALATRLHPTRLDSPQTGASCSTLALASSTDALTAENTDHRPPVSEGSDVAATSICPTYRQRME
ncbi:hypothetical protein evm_001774 [Chilo suppressalis]|nr:hypothetical protein evm_001774 [Chilo suppressalis]